MMKPASFFAEEVTVKPTALNSPPPRTPFSGQTTKHTTIHCIGAYNMLFTDGYAVFVNE